MRHRASHHPTDAPKPRNANTTANTPNPTTHRANTPTTGAAPLFCAHTVLPTRLGVGVISVRAGGAAPRHEAKQAKPPQGRARRTSAHKASAQTMGFAPKRCRPAPARRGRAASERPLTIAHAKERGLSVFVGVFADVCRRFWAGWFGGLGVFWGCLACFLVF